MSKLVVVHVEPIDITFDAETFARGGEIICEECDEEYAEHRLHYNDVRGVNFVQLCHDCFSKSHIQQHA